MNSAYLSLPAWLELLENRQQQEIQLGLTRINAVAHQLSLLRFDAKIITVAGTNGKGSTVAALEHIYSMAGYRVASFTSPHLISFNERIRVNLKPISDKSLCEAFSVIEYARGLIDLTYFEMTTLAALWYFSQLPLDVIILEVGMGGRLDATNIIDSDLAIITTIDLDHQAYLGHSKESIGYEKAGILRANKPYIYADNVPPQSIIEHAEQLQAGRINYSHTKTPDSLEIVPVLSDKMPHISERLSLPQPAIHSNAACAAVMASYYFSDTLPISLVNWHNAMNKVFILGRQQVIKGVVTQVLDVAHNPQAASLLATFIRSVRKNSKVHAVFSCLNDKDLRGLIQPMHSYVDFWYSTVLSSKRAASEFAIRSAFEAEQCILPVFYKSPMVAYHAAMEQAKPNDLVVVYGSFLMLADIMATHVEVQEELQ